MFHPFLICDKAEAETIAAFRSKQDDRIEPRLIAQGRHADRFAIPARVAADPAFADLNKMFVQMDVAFLNIEDAFPAEE